MFIPPLNKKYQTTFVLLTKTALVAGAALAVAGLMNDIISKYVICLLFGVVAAEIGFLEGKPITKSNSFGYLILALMAYIFTQLAKATPEILKGIARPLLAL